MRTKNIIFTFLFFFLFCSCNNDPKSKLIINKSNKDTSLLIVDVQAKEDFQLFLTSFQQDSVFQYKRIIFPLKNILYNTETDEDDETTINKNDWTFTDFVNLPPNYLKNIEKINDDEYHFNVQIEDTGVSVSYIFKINHDKWYLVEIVDEST